MTDRARITGVVLTGIITGIVALLAMTRELIPGEVALVASGDDRRLVREGWVIELPWTEAEYYRLEEDIRGKALVVSADGLPLSIEWSAVRILYPEKLLHRDQPTLQNWDRLLPRLTVDSLITEVCGGYPFDDIYGGPRARLTRRVRELAEAVLEGLAIEIAGLRLTSVQPLGDAGDSLGLRPPRLVIIALDNLDSETMERLLAGGRLPALSRLRERGALVRLVNPRPDDPSPFWRELLTGGLPAGNWIDRRARRGWLTGVINGPLQTAPPIPATVEGYDGPVYEPPDPQLFAGETGLETSVRRMIQDSIAVGALLDAGAAVVCWGVDLFREYYDALWPLVQRYRSISYGARFPAAVNLDEGDLIRAAESGAMFERLLTALDRYLEKLLERHPELTIAIVSSGGYGPRSPEDLSSIPWGPQGEAWLLLSGPHIRPLGEREGTVNGAAMLLGELALVERLSETGGIGVRDVLEPFYRERLTLSGPRPPPPLTAGEVESKLNEVPFTGAGVTNPAEE